ncbi:CDP-diacylglycerol--serine O-phosphatidyltransferase [Rhodobacteraceae bacterium B1Z28]|uniref:CDP-diacylglycerol--serine O-phosphatidyltransferase n=1 Tax=Ruegeria haliotis TaxID=2747601 RepID=A0ABX2PWS8_9RHOB|nr:CDP-diacylglycerol--serine O-phosphatidyltransferase [Ruegeria haliotis]NVO58650.1 CDP-diacylglycerol--serine O-phosphatidyltransferase [Ruegeria haliotis]
MADPLDSEKRSEIRLIYLLPNLITIAAICAGLTAIRFGYEGNFEMAVRLVLAACVLDGLDGRVARLLNRSTAVGAELDSLADFVNFGVAPVLILHSWVLQDFQNAGWIAVLFYAICCVLRLARFNVSGRLEIDDTPSEFFVGVPSPAGAVLVMLPMVVSFAVSGMPLTPPVVVAFYICLIGLLMISRIPTYSFKNMSISRFNAKFFLLGAAILAAALLTYLWATLTILTLAYVGCLVWAYRSSRKSKPTEG